MPALQPVVDARESDHRDSLAVLVSLGFVNTRIRLALNPGTGRITRPKIHDDYADSHGVYAWVCGREVCYIGETNGLRARTFKHCTAGPAMKELRRTGVIVEVWFLEEPTMHVDAVALRPRRGRPLSLKRPDVFLVERFLIDYGREHDWPLWNFV